jgi:hypothetical protein
MCLTPRTPVSYKLRVGFSDWKTFTKALPEDIQELIDYHTYGKQAQEAKKAVMVSIDNCVCAINNHCWVENSPLNDWQEDDVDRYPNFMTWVLPSHWTISGDDFPLIARDAAGLYKDDFAYVHDEMYGDMKWYRAMPFYFKSRIEAIFEVQVEICLKCRKIETITDKYDNVLWDTDTDLWKQEEHRERLDLHHENSWRMIRNIDRFIEYISHSFIRLYRREE